jgi:hypothetical protein
LVDTGAATAAVAASSEEARIAIEMREDIELPPEEERRVVYWLSGVALALNPSGRGRSCDPDHILILNKTTLLESPDFAQVFFVNFLSSA